MKKRVFILCIIAVCLTSLLTVSATGCKDKAMTAEESVEAINQAVSFAKEITVTTIISDKGVEVRRSEQKIDLSGDKAKICITETKLNSSFEKETATSDKVAEKSEINNPFNIKQENTLKAEATKEGFSCVIPSEKIAETFGSEISAGGDATINAVFDGKKATSVVCEFYTSTNKRVTVTYGFAY